jgi:hypothetical protein
LVFPTGNKSNNISLYLDCPDSDMLPHSWSRRASFKLTIIDQLNESNSVVKGMPLRRTPNACPVAIAPVMVQLLY